MAERGSRNAVVFFLSAGLAGALCAPAALSAAEGPNSTFAELCAICHGAGGKGDGPSAAGLHPKPADFTNCSVMEKDSDETLLAIIKRGGQAVGRSSVMPSWQDSLTDGQIRELVALVRGFCKR